MAIDRSSKSGSGKMSVVKAFRTLGLQQSASINEINQAFKKKLEELQNKYADRPDKMVEEGDALYGAYTTAYLSKDPEGQDKMLPLTMTGPDSLLNIFGIQEVPHQSLKVQMQSKAQYKDGQLVNKASTKTESFINKDGKRETKIYENGKLIKHTIDDKNVI